MHFKIKIAIFLFALAAEIASQEDSTTTTSRPCVSDGEISESDRLTNYLKWALRNFGNWLIENNLDPTPPITFGSNMTINNSFLKFQGVFSNQSASNISRSMYESRGSVTLFHPTLTVWLDFYNTLNLHGHYSGAGEIISTYPISGEGNWTISNTFMFLEFSIMGFGIKDGYIDITDYGYKNITLIHTVNSRDQVSIPDLVTEDSQYGLGGEILSIMGEAIPDLFYWDHPVVNILLEYLDGLFSSTPLVDIINNPCHVK